MSNTATRRYRVRAWRGTQLVLDVPATASNPYEAACKGWRKRSGESMEYFRSRVRRAMEGGIVRVTEYDETEKP